MYRLIALDVDGTLVDHDLQLSPRVRAAVNRVQARGVTVTLATGRGPAPLQPFVQALSLAAPLICYQGALVYDPLAGRVLHRATLPRDLALDAVAWAHAATLESSGRHPQITIYLDGEVYLEEYRHAPEFYDRWFGLPSHLVPDLAAALDQDPEKILFIGDPQESDFIHRSLSERLGGRLQVLRTHAYFVELVANEASKGRALAWLAGHLRVPQNEVIAIGDSENDLSMVSWAGLGVAMANATPDVKAIADWMAPPVTEDGVAVVLERFVLNVPPAGRGETW